MFENFSRERGSRVTELYLFCVWQGREASLDVLSPWVSRSPPGTDVDLRGPPAPSQPSSPSLRPVARLSVLPPPPSTQRSLQRLLPVLFTAHDLVTCLICLNFGFRVAVSSARASSQGAAGWPARAAGTSSELEAGSPR